MPIPSIPNDSGENETDTLIVKEEESDNSVAQNSHVPVNVDVIKSLYNRSRKYITTNITTIIAAILAFLLTIAAGLILQHLGIGSAAFEVNKLVVSLSGFDSLVHVAVEFAANTLLYAIFAFSIVASTVFCLGQYLGYKFAEDKYARFRAAAKLTILDSVTFSSQAHQLFLVPLINFPTNLKITDDEILEAAKDKDFLIFKTFDDAKMFAKLVQIKSGKYPPIIETSENIVANFKTQSLLSLAQEQDLFSPIEYEFDIDESKETTVNNAVPSNAFANRFSRIINFRRNNQATEVNASQTPYKHSLQFDSTELATEAFKLLKNNAIDVNHVEKIISQEVALSSTLFLEDKSEGGYQHAINILQENHLFYTCNIHDHSHVQFKSPTAATKALNLLKAKNIAVTQMERTVHQKTALSHTLTFNSETDYNGAVTCLKAKKIYYYSIDKNLASHFDEEIKVQRSEFLKSLDKSKIVAIHTLDYATYEDFHFLYEPYKKAAKGSIFDLKTLVVLIVTLPIALIAWPIYIMYRFFDKYNKKTFLKNAKPEDDIITRNSKNKRSKREISSKNLEELQKTTVIDSAHGNKAEEDQITRPSNSREEYIEYARKRDNQEIKPQTNMMLKDFVDFSYGCNYTFNEDNWEKIKTFTPVARGTIKPQQTQEVDIKNAPTESAQPKTIEAANGGKIAAVHLKKPIKTN